MKKKLFWLAVLIILAALVTGFTLLIGCGQSTRTGFIERFNHHPGL